jgi:hypothetical protein
MAGICARTGRAGQAHTDLFVPSTIRLLSYHRTRSKLQSLELPQNTERKRLGRREGGEKSKQKC